MSSKIEATTSSYVIAGSNAPSPALVPTPVADIKIQDITSSSPTAEIAKQQVEESLKQMIAKEANIQDSSNLNLSFGIDKATERVYAQVKDSRTGEVIKQIPSKEFLEMMARIQSAVDGFIIDTKG